MVLSASWLSVPCKSGFSPQRPSSWASLGLFREHPCLSKTRCFVQYILKNPGSSNSPRLRELSLLASRGFGGAFGRLFRCCCPYFCGVRPANPGSRRLWLARLGCLFLLKSEMHVSRSPQEPFPRQCEVLTRRPSSFACVKLRKMQVAVLLVLPPTTLLCEQSPTAWVSLSFGLFPFASSRPVRLNFLSTSRPLAWP